MKRHSDQGKFELTFGSDVEIAQSLHIELSRSPEMVIFSEDSFWRYTGKHWAPFAQYEMQRNAQDYDGVPIYAPSGRVSYVKLNKSRINSILHEYSAMANDPNFFNTQEVGINCASGFIRFDAVGNPTLEKHRPDHRCRHTLPGRWEEGANASPPPGSLLATLLAGCFGGDSDSCLKINLLAEILGAVALGYGTKIVQPRAVILYGKTAENGKSQVLDLARGLLPRDAVCSVPVAKMSDDRHVIGLAGKLLNACDELSHDAIRSEGFKSVVTGEPIDGRGVYRERLEFRSMCQNVFATNHLPAFKGGMDRGVLRRLLVLPFNRSVPLADRVENIGKRIAVEEPNLLLAFAVEGAISLVRRRNFEVPQSCRDELNDWVLIEDPVRAWFDACVTTGLAIGAETQIRTNLAYMHFLNWAQCEGYRKEKLADLNGFVQQAKACNGIQYKRTAKSSVFFGLSLSK